ncbi:hypothetical protein [Pseudomonas putida]
MSRSIYDIAASGVDELHCVEEAFDSIRAIFALLAQKFPEGHLARDLAQLGLTETNEWSDKVQGWALAMDAELVDAGKVAGEALAVERRRASSWWTCLNEMRSTGDLPAWAAKGAWGREADHDDWLAKRGCVDVAVLGSVVTPARRAEVAL